MQIKLKKHYFSRNRHREEEYGSLFGKASNKLLFLMNMIIAGVFTPAVMATSLASKDMVLMLANISLSVGYLSNFAYRLFSNEVSISELMITSSSIIALLGVSLYFLPAITAWNLLNVVNVVSHIATAVNGFALLRNIIVPPLKRMVEYVALYFGFKIGGNFFSRKPLMPKKDLYAIDRLFMKHYGYDSVKSKRLSVDIAPFNHMIVKLSAYINKYNETLLGSVSNLEEISSTEKLIGQLTVEGNSSNCIIFFHKKLSFKNTKLRTLNKARDDLLSITPETDEATLKERLKFFSIHSSEKTSNGRADVIKKAVTLIDDEITRQEEKMHSLETCLP